MKEFNVQADFPVSVPQFFDLFFLSPKFKLDFHVVRGDSEVSVGDWKELGNNKYERAIKFCSQVSDQAIIKKLTGGMAPIVHEKQDYEFVDKALHVSSLATSSAGGFTCATTTDYTITELMRPPSVGMMNGHTDGCHVDIVVKNEFKSRLFKGSVESMMSQQASQSFEQWIALVKTKIAEMHKEEQLRLHQKTQPLPIPDYLMDTLSSTHSTTTEASEYDETDDDSYFDAPDHFTSPPLSRTSTPTPSSYRSTTPPPPTHAPTLAPAHTSLSALVQSMHKELQQVRSMTEVNSSRLLGLEASKHPHPSPSSSPSSSLSPPHPSPSLTVHEGLLPYLQRLDLLARQQDEESQRSKEKELEWRRRVEEMERRVESMGVGGKGWRGGRMVPWWGVVVFLLVWPVMAQKLWKYAKVLHPMVSQVFWKMVGR